MPFSSYAPEHAARLQTVLACPDWQEALADGALEAARASLRLPPPVTNVFALPVSQLKAVNEPRARALIEARGAR